MDLRLSPKLARPSLALVVLAHVFPLLSPIISVYSLSFNRIEMFGKESSDDDRPEVNVTAMTEDLKSFGEEIVSLEHRMSNNITKGLTDMRLGLNSLDHDFLSITQEAEMIQNGTSTINENLALLSKAFSEDNATLNLGLDGVNASLAKSIEMSKTSEKLQKYVADELNQDNLDRFEAQSAILKSLTDPQSDIALANLKARADTDAKATSDIEREITHEVNVTLQEVLPARYAAIGEFVRNVSIEKSDPEYKPSWNFTLAVRTEMLTGKNGTAHSFMEEAN